MPNFSPLALKMWKEIVATDGKTDTERHAIFPRSPYKFLTPPLLCSEGITKLKNLNLGLKMTLFPLNSVVDSGEVGQSLISVFVVESHKFKTSINQSEGDFKP